MADLRSWLIGTVRGLAPDFSGTVDLDTPLADGGLCFDSVCVLELVSAIETRTGLRIPEDQIIEANFATVGRLLRFLAERV